MKSYKKMTLSEKEIPRELYDAIKEGGWDSIVDIVEEGNMNAVTSNAVAKALSEYIYKTGSIIVTVKNFITGDLLENIPVKVGNTTLTTDSVGMCVFDDLKYGSYMIKIYADGYDAFMDSIYLDDVTCSFTAELTPEEAEYGTANITVIDKTTLEGINNATVKVDNITKTTNDQGKCSFTQLHYGSYIAQVTHDLYNDAFDTFSLYEATYDETVEMVVKSESNMGNVTVVVADSETSLPVKLAKVTLGSQSLFTSETGECTFKNVTYGSYIITASYNNYETYESTIDVESEETLKNINITKLKGTINLTVIDESTSVILPNASVTIDGVTKVTGTDGKCSFTDMNYDSYVVEVKRDDYNDYKTIIELNKSSVDQIIKLSQTVKTGNVNVYVKDGTTQEVLSNVSVTLNTETKETDSEGKCVFTNLIYSSYVIQAVLEDYVVYEGTVTVDASEVDCIISLTPEVKKGDLYITIKDNTTGTVVSGAAVTVGNYSTESDSKGECYVLDLPYDDYLVTVVCDGYATYKDTITISTEETNYTINITPNPPTSTVNVTVTDETTGNPVEAATVVLNNVTNKTNAEGKCSFTDLLYDDYPITVSHDGYTEFSDTITVSSETVEYPVKLTPIIETGTVNVNVTDTNSNPIESAIVKLGNSSQTTDATGKCTFTDVAYDTYDIIITHDKYTTYTSSITVDSEIVDHYAQLTLKTGTVNVTVKDKDTSTAIESASVELNGKTNSTDADGKCSFSNVTYGDYDIKVTHDNYNEYTSTITVDSETVDVPVELVPTEADVGTINVTVTDKTTGSAVENASVTIGTITNPTDSTGKCSFTNMAYGDYTITIIHDNYEDYTANISLASESLDYPVSLTLKTGTVNVTVTDTNNNPVEGATVAIEDNSQTTDATGKCSLTNVAYGNRDLTVSHDDYEYYAHTITIDSESMDYPVELSLKTGTVNVTVTDNTTDTPVSNASVKIDSTTYSTDAEGKCSFTGLTYGDHGIEITCTNYNTYTDTITVNSESMDYPAKISPIIATGTVNVTVVNVNDIPVSSATVNIDTNPQTTDADGKCSFSNITYGSHELTVTHDDYTTYTETITVDSETVQCNVTLSLKPVGTINVTVTNKDTSVAVENASVTIEDTTYTTDTDGKCSFIAVPYGDHTITVTHNRYYDYTATITLDSESMDCPVQLSPGPATGTLNITVTDSTTETPIEGVTVTMFGGSYQTTDASGKCSFTKLMYGIYNLTFTHDNYETYNNSVSMNNDIVEYPVQLTPKTYTGTVNVTVVNVNDIPVSSATVKIDSKPQTTDASGKCSFSNIVYGSHELTITHDDYNDYAETITVDSETEECNVVLTLKPVGVINVTVTDKDTSTAVSDASVTIEDTTYTTDEDGKCSFIAVKYGEHTIDITCTGYENYTDTLTVDSASMEYPAQLTPKPKIGTINVTVTDNTTSNPVESAKVIINETTNPTDATGKCSFTDLAYGDYPITVTHDSYVSYTGTVTLASETMDYPVELTPSTKDITFKGHVVDEAGANLEEVTITIDGIDVGTTDTDGNFDVTINALTNAAEYQIVFNKTYYTSLTVTVAVGETEYTIDTQTLSISEYIPSSTFTGTVKTLNYESTTTKYETVGDFAFTLEHATRTEIYEVTSDSDGAFTVEKMAPGFYNIVVPGSEDYKEETFSNAFFLRPAEGVSDYELIITGLRHDYTLKVLHENGYAAVGYNIKIHETDSTEEIASVTTSDMGTCTFRVTNENISLTADITMYDSSVVTRDLGTSTEVGNTITIPNEDFSDLTVIVKDLVKDMALVEATVKLSNGTSATTDKNGQCTFKNLLYGTYTITTDCLGYQKDSFEFVVNEHTETYKAYLEAKNLCDYVVYVRGANLMPVEGAVLTIGEWRGISDANGKYTFGNLSFGTHELKITHSDYDTYTETVDLNNTALVDTIQLKQTSKKTNIYFTVEDSFSGTKIGGVGITVQNMSTGTAIQRKTINGECEFTDYERTNYKVTIEHSAFETQSFTFAAVEGTYNYNIKLLHNPSTVTVTALARALTEESPIDPIFGATVILGDQSGTTDENGQCSLTLYSGEYTLEITEPDFHDYNQLVTVDGSNINLTAYVIRSSVANIGDLKVIAQDAATGKKLEGATLVAAGDYTGITNKEGLAIIKSIDYGTWNLTIKHDDYDTYSNSIVIQKETNEYTIGLTQTEQKTNIHFTVQDSFSGYKINGAHVSLYNTERKDTTSATTGESGTCSFNGYLRNNYEATITHGAFETQTITIDATEKEYNITMNMKHNPVTVDVAATNSDTKEVVEDAKVTLDDRTFITDSSGKCRFENVYSNNYQLIILNDKYYDYLDTITVDGQAVSVNASLTTLPAATGSLQVNIVNNRTDEPVEGAKVTIDTHTATTDATGWCTLRDLPLDEYTMKVTCEHYDDYSEDIVFDEPIVEHYVRLLQDKQTSIISFTIQDDFSAFKIGGAHVKLYDTIREVTNEATTDDNGNCSFNGYLYGVYQYTVEHGAYEGVSSVPLEVYEPTVQTTVNLKHSPTTVTIYVKDKSTQSPLSYAKVTLGEETLTTIDEGKVVFGIMYSGVYSFDVKHADYKPYTDVITVDGSPVTYTAYLSNETGAVKVTVKDNYNQNPISGATVNLGDNYSDVTGEDGTCLFPEVTYSTYQYSISKDDYTTAEGVFKVEQGTNYLNDNMEFVNCVLNVTVTDSETSTAIENATVTVPLDKGGTANMHTDKDGKASIKGLLHGEHSITISHSTHETYTGTITLADEVTEFPKSLGPLTGTVYILVLDNNTKDMIEGATVKLTGAKEYTETTTEAGGATFKNVALGEYELIITDDDYDTYTDTVTCKTNYQEYTKLLTPASFGTFNLTVVNSKYEPIPNAAVTFAGKSCVTTLAGKCVFSNVKYGDYALNIVAGGYEDYFMIIIIYTLTKDFRAILVKKEE